MSVEIARADAGKSNNNRFKVRRTLKKNEIEEIEGKNQRTLVI